MPKRIKFPLPKNLFPPLALTEQRENELERLTRSIVEDTVVEYEQHLIHSGRRGVSVDRYKWEPVKTRENVTVYHQRKSSSKGADTRLSSLSNGSGKTDKDVHVLLTTGKILGDLNDVMFGVLSPTEDAMRLKTSYVHDDALDCGVLAPVIPASPIDPFRFLGLKWMVVDAPARVQAFVRKRDFVYVESTGILTRPNGDRIGYHVMHSVECPGVRVLDEYEIVRGKLSFCHLFRQQASGVVELYSKGSYDPLGDMIDSIAIASCSTLLVSSAKLLHCAYMKKLAWLAQNTQPEESLPVVHNGLSTHMACSICRGSFHHMWKREVTCGICCQVVCRRCIFHRKISVERPDMHVIQQKLPFCSGCINLANQENSHMIASQEILNGATTGAYVPDHSRFRHTAFLEESSTRRSDRWKSSSGATTSSAGSYHSSAHKEEEGRRPERDSPQNSPPSSSYRIEYLL
ncbi:TPA: hypothetical protein N0F65_000258 [Lagenidium giganteum]|uniref:FYVE-type domain-containing protein n=1 Tax=Lagenidium giganteum TaxID=4803 RepID=A0AAV2Z6T1_9STRA|nr:TPA: hypothetical protein N0F65_000258 [Lagenidium giganteum]